MVYRLITHASLSILGERRILGLEFPERSAQRAQVLVRKEMMQSRRWAIVNQGLGVNIWDTEQHAFWRRNRGCVASIQEEFAQTQGRPAAERKLEVANNLCVVWEL